MPVFRSFQAGLFLTLQAICLQWSQAQSNLVFEHLTTDHGLSSNRVEDIIQDDDGFYWIATQNGLNRFDGTTFRVYQNVLDDETSLTHNHCLSLAKAKDGDIWVTTYHGISRFLRRQGRFQRIYLSHPTRNHEVTNRVFKVAIDRDGDAWFAGYGLWKYDVENDSISYYPPLLPETGERDQDQFVNIVADTIRQGIWLSSVSALYFFDIATATFHHRLSNPRGWKIFDAAQETEVAIDRQQRIWFVTKDTRRLAVFDSKTNTIKVTTLSAPHVRFMYADPDDRIWLSFWVIPTVIYDIRADATDTMFLHPYHRQSALSESSRAVYRDEQNNYWIASGNGISIYNALRQYYKIYPFPKMTGRDNVPVQLTSIAQTDPGSLWVGTSHGLFAYDLQRGTVEAIHGFQDNARIYSCLASSDALWFFSAGDLMQYALSSGEITTFGKFHLRSFIGNAEDGHLWIGTWPGDLYYYNTKEREAYLVPSQKKGDQGLKRAGLLAVLPDDKVLWIGYNGGGGLTRYDTGPITFRHYQPGQMDSATTSAGTITCISSGQDDKIWLGTYGAGLFEFDTNEEVFRNFRQEHGLQSNFINSMVPDAAGNLWISSADGICRLDIQSGMISRVDPPLIFPDNDFMANGIAGKDGALYFFYALEIVEIRPQLYRAQNEVPRVVVSSFKVFDREYHDVSARSSINLAYRENFFSFEYSALRTHPMNHVRYAYILEGFDDAWQENGRNIASYTNVPHGEYRFQLKATNSSGDWSDVLVNIPISIKPPFWKTWWFLSLMTLLVLGSVYAFYRYRIGQIRRIYDLKTKISRDLHDDVGSSLSSIHIYSTVAEKALASDPEKAKEIVGQIKQNSKQVLESMGDIVWSMNTEQPERESLGDRVRNYGSDLLAQQHIQCTYEIDPAVEGKLRMPEVRRSVLLVVKEALNNIAKYSEASQARVRIVLQHSMIHISITDNGKGFDPLSARRGNGLHNMQQRVQSLRGTFALESSAGNGTRIVCQIPLTGNQE